MVESGVIDRFEEQRTELYRRAALRSSGHAWRTAAVMIFFLAPLGPLFGGVALWCMRGLGPALDGGREVVAEKKLRTARALVTVGSVLGTISLLAAMIGVFELLLYFIDVLVGGYAPRG